VAGVCSAVDDGRGHMHLHPNEPCACSSACQPPSPFPRARRASSSRRRPQGEHAPATAAVEPGHVHSASTGSAFEANALGDPGAELLVGLTNEQVFGLQTWAEQWQSEAAGTQPRPPTAHVRPGPRQAA
jgi:hypothetical protein